MTESGFESAGPSDRLEKKSLKDEVFEYLHKRIVAGNYSPGEWLRQEEISTTLDVSQTPVREALDRLVSVGLAERVPYRGVRVPRPSEEEILDAYVLRLLLETTAARMAAENISPEQVRYLAEIVEQTKELVTLDDMSLLQQLNKKFHLAIVKASGNSLLTKSYEVASNVFPDWRLYEYMFRHPELLQSSLFQEYQEHKSILEAIASGDADRAARHTVEHIHKLGRELVDFLGITEDTLNARERQIEPFSFAERG
ncbi:MAG TPA: GntR family transcriptional regulator [Anaerolineales bacterium]|nr:GntR family transcriptional regulator [Anaerolineales bacterium]